MKRKLCVIALSAFMANAWAGKVDFTAGEGLIYDGIAVKLKASVSAGNTLKNPPDNSLSLLLKEHKLSAESMFYPSDKSGKTTLKAADVDPIALKNGLDRYLQIDLPADKKRDIKYINELLEKLAKESSVEIVYPESQPVSLSVKAEETTIPDFTDQQYYLKAPDDKKPGYTLGGLNIIAADKYPGGRGEGVGIISLEAEPWFTENTNLPANAYPDASEKKQDGNQSKREADHDSASVGIMAARNRGYGVVGAAYKADKVTFVNTAQELIRVLPKFKAGDVIQVGVAATIPRGAAGCESDLCGVPLEYRPAVFDAFKTATDKGIHVVAGAGNHNINLDDPFFEGKFDRSVRDAHTILVGAVCGKDGKKAYFSSYGSAIDVSAWGCFDITTTGYGDLYKECGTTYTAKYSGTSAANPQIAGLVANLSGIAKKDKKILDPEDMRELLKKKGGTLIPGEEKVGYYPDLKPAADYIINYND